MYIFFFRFFSLIGDYKILSRVPQNLSFKRIASGSVERNDQSLQNPPLSSGTKIKVTGVGGKSPMHANFD